MINLAQVIGIAGGFIFLLIVLEFVRRRLLTEEYAVIWIICAIGLIGLAMARRSLDALGIHEALPAEKRWRANDE